MPITLAKPEVQFVGDRLVVNFDRFDIFAYRRFLELKKLPESTVDFHPETESYTVSAPARFAAMLGVERPVIEASDLPFSDFLFDDQDAISRMIQEIKRFACWSDCGLGKTVIELETARHVIHKTRGKVLLFTLNDIVEQIIAECEHFYAGVMPIVRLDSREAMKEWCASGGSGLAITNYEKMNHIKGDQVVNQMRQLAGVILDESSRLKGAGGKQKWALIKSCKGIEYKLSCTATPAPNDIMEFCSQASFLERMKNDNEIIWTYFQKDKKSKRWTVKRHARKAFFEFMAGWSIYVRNPKKYGWRMDHPNIPDPVVTVHQIPPTPEQVAIISKLSTAKNGQLSFLAQDTNTVQRAKLSPGGQGVHLPQETACPRAAHPVSQARIRGGHDSLRGGRGPAGARVDGVRRRDGDPGRSDEGPGPRFRNADRQGEEAGPRADHPAVSKWPNASPGEPGQNARLRPQHAMLRVDVVLRLDGLLRGLLSGRPPGRLSPRANQVGPHPPAGH